MGGVIAGWLVGGAPAMPHGARRAPLRSFIGASDVRRSAFAFGLLGLLADFDFLFGTHSTYSHSVGAALVVSGVAFAWFTWKGRTERAANVVTALAVGAAYASHILLDWLGTDGSVPIGIMALWPFSRDFYLAGVGLFAPVDRRFWLPDFWLRVVRMLAIEVGILGSALTIVWWARTPRGERRPAGAAQT